MSSEPRPAESATAEACEVEPSKQASLSSLPAAAGSAALALAAVTMVVVGWRGWADPLIDFGREVYLPWRIVEGEVLYRDLAHPMGPLSVYFNALWFALFGEGVMTLVAVNAVLVIGLIVMIHRLAASLAGRVTAFVACLSFILLMAFSGYLPIGNYNFLCPYSHELTHGLMLTIAGLCALHAYAQRGLRQHLIIAGLALGLAVLTKPETALAAWSAGVVFFALCLWTRPDRRGRLMRDALICGAVALLPVVVAILLFRLAMDWGSATAAAFGAWQFLSTPSVVGGDLYRTGMGLMDPAQSVKSMLEFTGWWMVCIALPLLLAWRVRATKQWQWMIGAAVAACLIGPIVIRWRTIDWEHFAVPLPVIIAVIAIVNLRGLARRPDQANTGAIMIVVLATASMALLLKMIAFARIAHYGFALAAPAVVLVAAMLLHGLPRALGERLRSPRIYIICAYALWLTIIGVHLRIFLLTDGVKQHQLGVGRDAIVGDQRAAIINDAVEMIHDRATPTQTLVAVPEGIMINYLTRLQNPTPYVTYMPLEVSLYGESNMIASFDRQPPDIIAVVHRDTTQQGPRFFGIDYARDIGAWIDRHYEPVELLGDMPLRDDRFGIVILLQRRGEALPSPAPPR